jgi:glyoxylase-like metal-dependent hydrolase (beta-lactamase superfamily II)
MERIKEGLWVKRGNTNVGLIEVEGRKYLVDTGSSEKFAKELLSETGNVDSVLHTHSHADHIQGNYLFADGETRIYVDKLEVPLIKDPSFESFCLYGANPPKTLKRSFFKAKGAEIFPFESAKLPAEIELIDLHGHSIGMTGIKFEDVLFCGDAYFGEKIIQKYIYPYLINAGQFLESIDKVLKTKVALYIPSHGDPSEDPSKDIEATRKALMMFINLTIKILSSPKSVEEVCFEIAESQTIALNTGTFYLFRSFESAVLSYLEEKGEIINTIYGKWQIR